MFLLQDLPEGRYEPHFERLYGDIPYEALSLFLSVMKCGSDLLAALDKHLSTHGLLHGRWITLVLLRREVDLTSTPAALAEKQGVSRATMSGLLKSLEEDGLITRLQDEADKRSVFIRLSAAGEDKLAAIMPAYYARVAALADGIDAGELKQAVRTIQKLNQNASKLSS